MRSPNCTLDSVVGEINVDHRLEIVDEDHQLWLSPCSGGYRLRLGDQLMAPVTFSEQGEGRGLLRLVGETLPVRFAIDGDTVHLHIAGQTRSVRYLDPLRILAVAQEEGDHLAARAPMPGVVVATRVSPGEQVAAGAALMVIESMKLETVIRAPKDGIVDQVHVKDGDSFDRDAVLVTLSQEGR
jgi:3-methylcrotonyl-CoA carboxylase alpha subunit